MTPVFLESPFAGDTEEDERLHRDYLQAAIMDCIQRGEAPFASHQMYTTALDDSDPEQRKTGILAGTAWRIRATYCVVYEDLGISKGMQAGIMESRHFMQAVKFRRLGGWSK